MKKIEKREVTVYYCDYCGKELGGNFGSIENSGEKKDFCTTPKIGEGFSCFEKYKNEINGKNKKTDPKYIGIPNINFSLIDKNDKREKEYSKQRMKRGFDDSEIWVLNNTIASFMLPRLEVYYEFTKGAFNGMEKFDKDIKKLINALRLFLEKDFKSEEDMKNISKGLKKFHKIFWALWC